ncbi:hypothetical protein O6H91_20G064000 [Diphasiastrum complanatum]|uniref:Uncharacterized protein n=1 Tax=Diphasiastrum complanatum TaxID=34168 RepID=A0ACC2AR73_DIPCM|nr:hypothetical protein O6H91_20G064000 [Diphasiastrum complanatum]
MAEVAGDHSHATTNLESEISVLPSDVPLSRNVALGGSVTPLTYSPMPRSKSSSPSPREVRGVQEGGLGTLTKGFLDSSKNAMKAVQLKARHLVSQNKRRYQEGGFDLDMTYITENVIAMGFPAGDMSSGLLGYVEGFYRNHMEEVIKFFETHHPGKYKVYNLCSERLYDAALFEGKVACFPFNDHNCPPLSSIMAFCQSAYAWLKGDLENVVVVHCKAGMARTGLMISSLLLYLKFFPTAEESIAYYNQKRCTDGKALVLPSQLRYVKYFERVLRDFNGNTPSGRRCILRGIRLHKCPYWVRPSMTIWDHEGVLFSTKKHPRTKDLMPEDFWFSAPRKGILVFALPGERCVADLNGDFKIHFQDRHGDFYCWLNTNMMDTRQFLSTAELDGFDKRRLPAPGFQVEIVVLDENVPPTSAQEVTPGTDANGTLRGEQNPVLPQTQASQSVKTESTSVDLEKDDIFSDSEGEDGGEKSRGDSHQLDETRTDQIASTETKLERTVSSSKFDRLPTARPDLETSASGGGVPGGVLGSQEHEASLAGLERQEIISRSGNSDQPGIESSQKDDSGQAIGNGLELPFPNQKSEVVPRGDAGVEKTTVPSSDFKAIAAASAADASVFTFGDDEDYDSEDD